MSRIVKMFWYPKVIMSNIWYICKSNKCQILANEEVWPMITRVCNVPPCILTYLMPIINWLEVKLLLLIQWKWLGMEVYHMMMKMIPQQYLVFNPPPWQHDFSFLLLPCPRTSCWHKVNAHLIGANYQRMRNVVTLHQIGNMLCHS